MRTGIRTRLLLSLVLATIIVMAAVWSFASAIVEPSAWDDVSRVLLFASAAGFVTAVVLAEIIARRFIGPIADLRAIADALAEGDLGVRSRSRRKDEIGALGRAVDRMADQLDERLGQSRAEEARLRVTLDAMEEAVLVTDASGQIVLSNVAFVRAFGSAATGKIVIEAIRSAELHEAVQRALAGRGSAVVIELSRAGATRHLSANVAPLPEREGAIAVLHDITALRRAESVRRDFVANASHELRTPLTAILGFAETLRDGALDEPRFAKRFVENIADNAKRLQRIVEDMITLSRAESPDARFALEPVDVVAVAGGVLTSLEGKASAKDVQLGFVGAMNVPLARANAEALDQVLLNLVENGIKYTPSGGKVSVSFGEELGRVCIEVSDTGPGIPAAHLPRIFERFYRVDYGRSREQGGTGLGLSIVRHLVSRMNGEVTVSSKIGKGTRFTVWLDDTSAAESVPPPESEERPRDEPGPDVEEAPPSRAAGSAR